MNPTHKLLTHPPHPRPRTRNRVLPATCAFTLAAVLHCAPVQFAAADSVHDGASCLLYAGGAMPSDGWCRMPVANKAGCFARVQPEMMNVWFVEKSWSAAAAPPPKSAHLSGECVDGEIHGGAILRIEFAAWESGTHALTLAGNFVRGVKHGAFAVTSGVVDAAHFLYGRVDKTHGDNFQLRAIFFIDETSRGAYRNGYKHGAWTSAQKKYRWTVDYDDGRVARYANSAGLSCGADMKNCLDSRGEKIADDVTCRNRECRRRPR